MRSSQDLLSIGDLALGLSSVSLQVLPSETQTGVCNKEGKVLFKDTGELALKYLALQWPLEGWVISGKIISLGT